jgi:hypothetical protein
MSGFVVLPLRVGDADAGAIRHGPCSGADPAGIASHRSPAGNS